MGSGGGITPAHADQYYWPLASDRTITAWIPLQPVPANMGPLGFYAGSQGVAFGRDLGISDESETRISTNMAAHGFAFSTSAFELGEVSFHLGWTFHKAGANRSGRPRSVMTVIYMDAQMRLGDSLSAAQRSHDRCRGVGALGPGVEGADVEAETRRLQLVECVGMGRTADAGDQSDAQWHRGQGRVRVGSEQAFFGER